MNDINMIDAAGAVGTSPQNEMARLRELAESARDYQLAREWTEARLCREIGHLGRAKLFARVLMRKIRWKTWTFPVCSVVTRRRRK